MMLSTTAGAAFDVSSSVRTQACCRRAALLESMLDSLGLTPLLARSKRDCGQVAKLGVAAALAELPPHANGKVSSTGRAAGSQGRVCSIPMSALVYRTLADRDGAPGFQEMC